MKVRDYAAMLALCAPIALAACSSSPKPAPEPAPAPVAAPTPPPAPTATPQQNQADKNLVRQVQTMLKQNHMYRGHIDGAWGRMTARGVTQFQKAHSLPTTGQLDDATLSAMNLQPTSGGAAPAGNSGMSAPGNNMSAPGASAPGGDSDMNAPGSDSGTPDTGMTQ